MKKYKAPLNRFSFLLLFFFVGSSAFMVSCEEDEQEFDAGVPVLERVRLTDPNTADSTMEQAGLGSTLVIVGQNLASTEAVFLNNYSLGVNPAYATETHLIVQVSDSVPTLATDPNVPNELRVINQWGEATMQFQTLPPAPIVEQISNQAPKPGETISLYGRYFYFVDTVHFPGGVYATGDEITATGGNKITVTVPESFNPTIEDSDIVVVSQSGRSALNKNSSFYDGAGMITDFDDINRRGWGVEPVASTPEGEIQPIDGNFAFINLAIPPNYGWDNNKYIHFTDWSSGNGEWWNNLTPEENYGDPEAKISDFEIRMEVAVVAGSVNDLENIGMQFAFFNEGREQLDHLVNLDDFVTSTDGTWYTISIPLSELDLATYGDLSKGRWNVDTPENPEDDYNAFRLIVQNTGAEISPQLKIAFDNIRIVNTAK